MKQALSGAWNHELGRCFNHLRGATLHERSGNEQPRYTEIHLGDRTGRSLSREHHCYLNRKDNWVNSLNVVHVLSFHIIAVRL